MEIGYEAATVTTVTLSEGTSRVLRSTGGGFFSAGSIASLRIAGDAFLKEARQVQPHAMLVREFPGPSVGQGVFYFRTEDGVYAASARLEELDGGQHCLSPLYHAGLRILHEFLKLQKQSKE